MLFLYPSASPEVDMLAKIAFSQHLSSTLASGLLVVVPLGLTYMVLKFLFDTLDGLLEPLITAATGRSIPGAGLVLLVLLVYIAGILTLHILGRRLLAFAGSLMMMIPVVNTVYGTAKKLIDSFSGTGPTGFKRVVMIEYPRRDCWTIGFLTGTTQDHMGEVLAFVFIPTAPTPNSGWVALVPYKDVRDTDLSIPTALRLVLSGGITAPEKIVWSQPT